MHDARLDLRYSNRLMGVCKNWNQKFLYFAASMNLSGEKKEHHLVILRDCLGNGTRRTLPIPSFEVNGERNNPAMVLN